jgi:hypothetical protein
MYKVLTKNNIFNTLLSLILILFFFLSSCSKEEIIEETILNSNGEAAKFVVDNFETKVVVKVNPQVDSLWSYVSHALIYHFENQPGTIFSYDIEIKDYLGVGLNITPAYPNSIDKQYTWNHDYWLKTDLAGVNNLTIKYQLKGSFWDIIDGHPKTFSTFDWSKENNIMVNR